MSTDSQGKITAVIPVREGSRRMKNKNIAPFNGTTLLEHKIEVLKKVPEVSDIVVTSDSEYMLQLAVRHDVAIHRRPVEYCDEVSRSFGEMVKYVCSQIEGDHILWAPCTAPLITPELFSEAIAKYFEALDQGYDSLVSVELFKRFLWNEEAPVNYELGVKQVPSQQLPNLYVITAGIHLAPMQKVLNWSYVYGPHPYKMEIDKFSAIDIDDELDFIQAEAWLKWKKNNEL